MLNNSSGTEVGTSSNPIQVDLANTSANSNKLLVTPDLPTGASTAAKQPALGTAGTASSDVITVQGVASMTPVQVSQSTATSLKTQAEAYQGGSAVASGNPLEVNLRSSTVGVATAANQSTANTSLSNIDTSTTNIPNVVGTAASAIPSKLLQIGGSDGTNARAISTTTGGVVKVDLSGTAANSTAVKVDGSAVTQPVSYATTGSGTATGALRVELANNGTGLVGLNAGTNAIGKLAANSGVDIGDVDVTTLGGQSPAYGAGATGSTVLRNVQANNAGKTIVSKGGSVSSSGNNTIVSAGSNKLKVFAFSLTTTSTTAVTVKFQDGAGGTDLWVVNLQAPTSVSVGANLAVTPPSYLFATSSATLLNINLSGAQTVYYSVSYYDEA